MVDAAIFDQTVQAIAEVLRTHQFDPSSTNPDRCFCGNQMGDQEDHQAIALVEGGWINPTKGHVP